jgi:S-formylglutathione hydrolase FrmB
MQIASSFDSTATVTRPANTTAYTAGDVVGGAYELTFAGPVAGLLRIDFASLAIAVTAVPSGMTSFRRHFYSRTPPSAIADNAAWDLTAADLPYYLGYIDVGSPVDVGSSLYVQVTQNQQPVKLETASLFCYEVTNGGFTPAANSEVYYMRCASLAV